MPKFYRTHLSPDERHPLIAWAFANGKSLKELRHDVGISNPSLHYWDTGKTKPSWTTLQRIERFTNGQVTAEMCFEYWTAVRKKAGEAA